MSDQVNKAYNGNRGPLQPPTSQASFAQRLGPIYPNWETFERALIADGGPTWEFSEAPGQYPHHVTCDPVAFATSRQDHSGDTTATSLESYPPNTLHPGRSQPSFYSLGGDVSPADASKSDAWLQESYSYDVSNGGGMNPVPSGSNEKQHQKVSCLKCGNVFNGQYGPRNLGRHVKSEHDHIIFPCKECPRTYKRDDALLAHERKSHPNLQRQPKIPRKKSDDSRKGSNSPSTVESNQTGSGGQISEPARRQVRDEADHGLEGRMIQTATSFL